MLFKVLLPGLLTFAGAEEPMPVRFDLNECISYSLQHNPLIKAAQQDIALANAQLSEARSGRKPRLELIDVLGVVPEARGNAVFSPDSSTDTGSLGLFTRLEFNLIQPVYTFGKLKSYTKAALHGLQAKKAGRAQSEGEVIFQVKQLYYALILNRQLAGLLDDTQKNFIKAQDKYQEIIEEGEEEVSLIDFVKLKLGLAEVVSNLKKLQLATDLTKTALRQTLGLPPKADFDITDEKLSPAGVDLKELDHYVSETFKNSPQWKQVMEGVRAKEALLKAAKRKYYPDLFIAVPFRYALAPNRDDQKNPFVNDNFNFIEGGPVFGLRWEFSFGGNKAKVEQAKAELKKLLAQRDAATLGMPVEVKRAFLEVLEMQERLDQMRKAYRSARGLVTVGAGAKGLGVQDPKELFESYGLYTKATSDYYLAIHSYNLAAAKLGKVVGAEISNLKY